MIYIPTKPLNDFSLETILSRGSIPTLTIINNPLITTTKTKSTWLFTSLGLFKLLRSTFTYPTSVRNMSKDYKV